MAKIAGVLECPVEELLAWTPVPGSTPTPGGAPAAFPCLLPVRGTVPFGRFKWPERLVAPVQLLAVPEELYEGQRIVLRAGDTTMEPEIRLNDLCIFDPAIKPVHGSIVCAQIGGDDASCTVRWYLDTEDAVVLNPENLRSTTVEPIVLVRQRGGVYRYLGKTTPCEIKGVLVGIVRSYAIPR